MTDTNINPEAPNRMFTNTTHVLGGHDVDAPRAPVARLYQARIMAAHRFPGHWYPVADYDANTDLWMDAAALVEDFEAIDGIAATRTENGRKGLVLIRGYVAEPSPAEYANPVSPYDEIEESSG